MRSAARPTLVRGDGLYVWDSEGRRYLDAISGAFCVQLGYGRDDLALALKETASRLPFARAATSDSAESLAYAHELLDRAGPPFARAIFTSSGSEAVDVAIKVAWRYQEAIGHPERTRVESVKGHFHGATIGALSVTGFGARRNPYARVLRSEDDPAPVAAHIEETIPAAGLGAPVPPPGHLARIRETCDATGSLWIADEVLTGFGRVGDLFAWSRLREREGDQAAVPDVVVFGKGAGAGYASIGGVLLSGRVAEALESFSHAQTYAGHAVACAVARRVLAALEGEGIMPRVRALEREARAALDPVASHHQVKDVRGLGFLWGIDLAGASEPVEALCRKRGILVYAGPGCLLIAPPLIASVSDFNVIAAGITGALDEAVEAPRNARSSR